MSILRDRINKAFEQNGRAKEIAKEYTVRRPGLPDDCFHDFDVIKTDANKEGECLLDGLIKKGLA